MASKEELKKRVCAAIDKRAEELYKIGDAILRQPELGFKEFKTTALVEEKFRSLGLSCQTGLAMTVVDLLYDGAREGLSIRADYKARYTKEEYLKTWERLIL
jgi:metal-dependent amidase/aminoacylase/carboxypeptidase family protein